MSDGHGKSAVSAPVIPNTTNYTVNNRSWSGGGEGIGIASPFGSPIPSASGTLALSYTAATGGNIAYEWQFLTYSRFLAGCTNAQNTTPLVGSAQTWNGPNSYNDSISGASSNDILFTGHPYYGTAAYHGIAGFWRLKASNSAGATYTKWHLIVKLFDTATYSCNCSCPCNTTECNCNSCCTGCCDENNENCTCDCTCGCSQCCDDCSETCDTCEHANTSDLGDASGCNW